MEDVKQAIDHVRSSAQDVVDEGDHVSIAALNVLNNAFGEALDAMQLDIDVGEDVTVGAISSIHWLKSQLLGAVVCLDADAIVAAAQQALDFKL